MLLFASVLVAAKVVEAAGERFPGSLWGVVSTCPRDDGTSLYTDKAFTPETPELERFFSLCVCDSVFFPLVHGDDEVSSVL